MARSNDSNEAIGVYNSEHLPVTYTPLTPYYIEAGKSHAHGRNVIQPRHLQRVVEGISSGPRARGEVHAYGCLVAL